MPDELREHMERSYRAGIVGNLQWDGPLLEFLVWMFPEANKRRLRKLERGRWQSPCPYCASQ